MAKKDDDKKSLAAFEKGAKIVSGSTIFRYLYEDAHIRYDHKENTPVHGWVTGDKNGNLYVNYKRQATPDEWAYLLAHALLHLGLGHYEDVYQSHNWNVACDVFVTSFLKTLKVGTPPKAIALSIPSAEFKSEEVLFNKFDEGVIDKEYHYLGTAGYTIDDMIVDPHKVARYYGWGKVPDFQKSFSRGIADSVSDAIHKVADKDYVPDKKGNKNSLAQKARQWFLNSYPLLGGLVSSFAIIEDLEICSRMNIQVAAVSGELKEIYINPSCRLTVPEYRFVIAHEILHVSLRHDERCQGRDPFIWNVACDYVINSWLLEMEVGEFPSIGMLHDPELDGLSAESVYDRIVNDMRRFRKLATLRGVGLGDILPGSSPGWWATKKGMELDEFYRSALSQGLEYHLSHGRGYLPGNLIEEIRALLQPPIPWDVELAKWFDNYFSPLEKRRTYARPSRRQSSTPDIARPSWAPMTDALDGRTFGVILDTSGSMDRNLLAKALGTIASYSISRDVPRVRVVFADAACYDQGYMAPDDIAGRVKVKGRGGTVLQPAVDLLRRADDFPKKGPILIITDGGCDRLTVSGEHAYVIPRGWHLPFTPKGQVFYIS